MFLKIFLPIYLGLASTVALAQAPDFSVTDSDGNTHNLYADFVNQDKVVVLEIFFTTCPPCNTHAPHWQNLYESVQNQYPGRVAFFMLSDKSADTNNAVAQYKTSKGLTMLAAGSDGGSLAAVQPYKNGQFGPFYGTPTFVVIKPGTGEVIFDVRGSGAASTMAMLQQTIDQLLELPECHVETPQGDTLQEFGLQVDIPGGDPVFHQVRNGIFTLDSFPGLPSLPFYEISPYKSGGALNGVSTFDLVLINRQILGITPFQEPWQFIAADANNSVSITTFDIIELRKLILGIYDSLPNSPSWVFSPALDTISPLECPEFVAIKKGDVNGNADPDSAQIVQDRNAQYLSCLLEEHYLQAGETYLISIRPEVAVNMLGLQAAFRIDPDAIKILDVRAAGLPNFDENCWHQVPGRLSISWFDAHPVHLQAFEKLVTLELQALQNGLLSSMLVPEADPLRAELYDAAGETHMLDWVAAPPPLKSVRLAPNPASDFVVLSLQRSALEETAVVQFINTAGQVIWEQQCTLQPGSNQLELRPDFLATGLYAVRLGGQFIGKLLWQAR